MQTTLQAAVKNLPLTELQESIDKPSPATESQMRRLWERMAEIYGHKWTSAYGDDAGLGAGQTWGQGLAGLNGRQIAAGIGACLVSADPWPPTLPAFRAMCLSIPTLAMTRATFTDWPRPPFVVLCMQRLDLYRFARVDEGTADRMLADAYGAAREHVMMGGAMPDGVAGLLSKDEPAPIKMASPEVVDKAVSEIRQALGATGKMAAAGDTE